MMRGIPMEMKPLESDIAEIKLCFETLTRKATNIYATLVFNPDASGFQDWADRRE
jgi:hypothetical protein